MILLLVLVLVVFFIPKKQRIESYGKTDNLVYQAKQQVPFVPTSAYSKFVNPISVHRPTSEDNPIIPMTSKIVDNNIVYSDSNVCKTPWSYSCQTNDDCAAFGIGEKCEGPLGAQYCVCETEMKEKSRPLNHNNSIVGLGAVCTESSQCGSGNCKNAVGQSSKMCKCKDTEEFDYNTQKCRAVANAKVLLDTPKIFGSESYARDNFMSPVVKLPDGTCSTVYKRCNQTSECSLGEGCTPDRFCGCQLISSNDLASGTFRNGAKCSNNDQCANNQSCVNQTCMCPTGQYYDFNSNYCVCYDSKDTVDPATGKCTNFYQQKRLLCNTTGKSCSSNKDAGLGEICDPNTHVLYCNADIHVNQIEGGARCETDKQCWSGHCVTNIEQGIKVCTPGDHSQYQYMLAQYAEF